MLKQLPYTGGIGSRCTSLVKGFLAVFAATLFMAPSAVFAQPSVCNGNINLGYLAGPSFAIPGDTYTVQAALGAGSITGGAANTLTVNRFRFELDCDSGAALGIPCTDDGALISYAGGLDDTGCAAGAPWSAAPNGSNANEIIFTPTTPVVIPANTLPAAGCILVFDITIDSVPSLDGTPQQIEEVVGYSVGFTDAQCDNNLPSGASQTGAIPLCQLCTGDDGNDCTGGPVCDQTNNTCGFPNLSDSTACTINNDIIGFVPTFDNDCVIAGCEAGICVADHADVSDSTACSPDISNGPVGDCVIPGCEAGVCVATHSNVSDSTACGTDSTPNDCTTPGCEAGVCVQTHTDVSDSTACGTDIAGDCVIPGCEAGVCVATHTDVSDSTACGTDSTPNDCTTPGCEAGVCVQTHTDVSDSTACGTDIAGDCVIPGCEAGVCVATHSNVSDSTACGTNIAGDCVNPGCESGVCVATHTAETDGNVCDDTDGSLCTTPACVAGVCDQNDDVVTCQDPNCEECDPVTGLCETQDPLPAVCEVCGDDPQHGCSIILLRQRCSVISNEEAGAVLECTIVIQNQSGGDPEPPVLITFFNASQFQYNHDGGEQETVTGMCDPEIPPDAEFVVADKETINYTCNVPFIDDDVNEYLNTVEVEIFGRNQRFTYTGDNRFFP